MTSLQNMAAGSIGRAQKIAANYKSQIIAQKRTAKKIMHNDSSKTLELE